MMKLVFARLGNFGCQSKTLHEAFDDSLALGFTDGLGELTQTFPQSIFTLWEIVFPMAAYFDTKLPTPITAGNRIYSDIEWHKVYPLLAISIFDDKKGGIVSVYNNAKDESTEVDCMPHPNVQVLSISWHPTQMLLGIGFESGEVIVWNHEEAESFEGFKAHQAPIMLLQWSLSGSILVSTDNLGSLVVWKSDYQGHLQSKAHHDLKDPVIQVAFPNKNGKRKYSTERTLSMLTSWRPKTGTKRIGTSRENAVDESAEDFYICLLSGALFIVKEGNTCDELISSGSGIKQILIHPIDNFLFTFSENFELKQFQVESNGTLNELKEIPIPGKGDSLMAFVENDTIAFINEDTTIQLLEFEKENFYRLDPNLEDPEEVFSSLDFNEKTGVLCCCTDKGKLVIWRDKGAGRSSLIKSGLRNEDKWELINTSQVGGLAKKAVWSPSTPGILALNGIKDVYLLNEQELASFYDEKISVLQISPYILYVELHEHNLNFEIKVDFQIKGISTSRTHIALWSGIKIVTYEVGPTIPEKFSLIGSFSGKCQMLKIHELSLFILEQDLIQVRTFQGTIKQTLSTVPSEGPPLFISKAGDYLTVATSLSYLKLWHIGRREAKLQIPAKNVKDILRDIGEIISAKSNSNGTKVAFTIALDNMLPDSRLHIWDLTVGKLVHMEFPNRFVHTYYWFSEDTKLLGLETKVTGVHEEYSEEESDSEKNFDVQGSGDVAGGEDQVISLPPDPETEAYYGNDNDENDIIEDTKDEKGFENAEELITMFVCSEHGFLIHERKEKDINFKSFLALDVPFFYIASLPPSHDPNVIVVKAKGEKLEDEIDMLKEPQKEVEKDEKGVKEPEAQTTKNKKSLIITKLLMKDFDGMEDADADVRSSIVNYIYYIRIGNVDDALQAMKNIQSEGIWESLAKSCVKTRRVDIALLCLAKMSDPLSIQIIKEVQEEEPEIEVHVATLAAMLDMTDEVIELYLECKRYDLLLEFYKMMEMWDKAIELCETHIRIELRTTYHLYGKYLEAEEQFEEAIEMYERAETYRYEVPRMLVDDPIRLEDYVNEKKEKELYQWWAQYLESGGEIEQALQYYQLSEDWLSLVRLLCFSGESEKAALFAERVNDKASAYHLARTFEDKGENDQAIMFYTKAGALGNAIRICKENFMLEKLWSLAVMADIPEKIDAARFFETKLEPPQTDKAIQLYYKAGYASKALELAFSTQEFHTLQTIAKDLVSKPDQRTDPMLLQKCASYFIANDEFERALDMLTAGHMYIEAMDLCVKSNLPITEEIAERLSAPKSVGLDESTRVQLLEKMGESCMLQGNYHLSAKKYTQAGNKVQAMKALLKSGDTERICFYANVSRHRDIYMMAANYLQTTDWRASEETIANIEIFYIKAKSSESLSSFYEICAQTEIEESKSYRKGLEYLEKAEKLLKDVSSSGTLQYEEQLNGIMAKQYNIRKFLHVKDTIMNDPEEAINDLRILLASPGIEESVAKGDAYSLLASYYFSREEYPTSYEVIKELSKTSTQSTPITKYVTIEIIQALEKILEIPFTNSLLTKVTHKVTLGSSSESEDGNEKENPFLVNNDDQNEEGVEFEEVEDIMEDSDDSEEHEH